MPAGINQLLATGIQDIYLTVNPEINIFQYTHYRYVNFANELIKIPLNSTASFGSQTYVQIPKTGGHLLSKIYLHIQLPALTPSELSKYASWSDTLGYAIFNKPVELQIGGVIVDRLYPVGMDMLDELKTSSNKLGHDQMILKGDMFRDSIYNATKPLDLTIPLEFWFTKDYALSLPLLSMTNQDIQLNFSFNTFNNLVNFNSSSPPDPVDIISSDLYVEYIFLDESIVEQFQSQKHQYVITQMVYNGDEIIPQGRNIFNTKLNFQNPCKEILFACVDQNNFDNNCYFNYSRRLDENFLISKAKLLLDGRNRYDINYLPEFIFRQLLPNNVHSVIPMKHMYIMPFAIKPEDYQPTGSANLSRFDEVTLSLEMTSGNPICKLYVFGIMYNIVTIENGVLSFEWLNNS
jgi:hypothetical protein